MQNRACKPLLFSFVIYIAVFSIVVLNIKEVAMAGITEQNINRQNSSINLPDIEQAPKGSLEQLLQTRRSKRSFTADKLSLSELSRLLFAAQGKTHPRGYRTAPSAGALYPLEVFLVAGEVETLKPGIYRYVPDSHELIHLADGDQRRDLAQAALRQNWIAQAPAIIVICAVYERVTGKYGQRGIQYVHIESGCAAQNLCLQAVDLNLGTTLVGAFDDSKIQKIIQAKTQEQPLLVIPVGEPR